MIKYNGTIRDSLSYDPNSPAKQRERKHNQQVKAQRAGYTQLPAYTQLPTPARPPAFQSMDPGGINLNIYDPNAPAKRREKMQNQKARKRRRSDFRGTPEASRRQRNQRPGSQYMPTMSTPTTY